MTHEVIPMSTEMNNLMRLLKVHVPIKSCLGGILNCAIELCEATLKIELGVWALWCHDSCVFL